MKQRLSNIELLRIISMLMIIMLHLLSFGGMLKTYNTISAKAIFIWLMESLSFVAVNCYVIISGYFLVDSNFKLKKLLNIWIEVLFYSLIIYFTLIFTNKIEFGYKALLKSFFPILLRNYWFVSVYAILYILSPFINKLIHSLTKKQYSYLVLIVFIFFSLWSTIIPPADTINYGGSYSISWFICLYLIAGYLKRFYSDKKTRKSICLCVYFIASLLNVIAYFGIKKLNIQFVLPDFLYNYYSITVLIAAISLFILFKNLEIKNKFINKAINFFAPTTFAIYLMYENPNVRDILWEKFHFVSNEPFAKMIFLIIIIPISLFVLLSLVDKLRLILFRSIAKIVPNNKFLKFKSLKKAEEILCQK